AGRRTTGRSSGPGVSGAGIAADRLLRQVQRPAVGRAAYPVRDQSGPPLPPSAAPAPMTPPAPPGLVTETLTVNAPVLMPFAFAEAMPPLPPAIPMSEPTRPPFPPLAFAVTLTAPTPVAVVDAVALAPAALKANQAVPPLPPVALVV